MSGMRGIKGIIIAGGFGTRLRPLTCSRPKHLLPVANRPFLEYQVALLRQHGIEEVIFATNYFAEKIEAHFGDGSRFGVRMQYALEREPLGTAGAIRNAAQLARGGTVMVFNGDVLTDFDLGAIVEFHLAREADATIALRPVNRPHAFGALNIDEEGRVQSWHEPTEAEKRRVAESPGPPTLETDFINAGIYVLESHVVEAIPQGRAISIERETYPALLDSGARVFGASVEGYWMDIGRPEQYLAANEAVLTGAVRTDVPFAAIDPTAELAPTAQIDSITSIGPGTTVEEDARLCGCIILGGSRVGRGAMLDRVIADEEVSIGESAQGRGSVLASGSVIQKGSRL